jgi:D-sedoheptulose 7-phosphate isomerase
MPDKEKVLSCINESIAIKQYIRDNMVADILAASNCITDSLKQGGKLLVCGNGGSAADAQHMAGEFVGRFKLEREGLPCIALTTDSSIMTAWSNDYGFDTVFSRQVNALGRSGDALLGLSTSGNSINVVKAIEEAKKKGMKTISLLGKDGGKIKDLCDISLVVKSDDTPRVQEGHGLIIHIICGIVENKLTDGKDYVS